MTGEIIIVPRHRPWWRRLLCSIGLHREDIVLVPVRVLDGIVDMPEHFVCTSCGHKRVDKKHHNEDFQVCYCETCFEMLDMDDPRLIPYQELHTYGCIFSPPSLVAIKQEAIEAHPFYKEKQQEYARKLR